MSKPDADDPKAYELFNLPDALVAFFARAGYGARLAIFTERSDGALLRPYDRRVLPALIATGFDPPKPGEVMARDALVRTADGGVDWSPEAKAVLARGTKAKAKKTPRKPTAKPKPRIKRAAAKRR